MRAEAKSFKFLSLEGKIKIPFFQRTYVWDEENWERLIEEFSHGSENFLGSIILKQLSTSSGEPKQLEVIDGQQRLTTLSILLKVLYDLFEDKIKENIKTDLWSILFYREDYTSSKYKIKIECSSVDKDAYEKVINPNNLPLDLALNNGERHKIRRCYKYFYENLKDKDKEKRKEIFNKILSTENKMLIVIDIDQNDDEQAIFDTLNTAGVRLSTAEIIKNALFQKIREFYNNDKQAIKFYNETWGKTFLSDEDRVNYWETERLTGRLKRDNIEILLHCFSVIKGFFDPDKHTLSDLSKLYKEEIQRKNSKEELETFIKEIIEYANIYQEKLPTFDNSTSFSFEDSINRLFHILEVLQISTFHPFILYAFKNYQDENCVREKLGMLEKFIVRRAIARHSVKSYNKYCKEFIKSPDSIFVRSKETTSEDISNGLKTISNKNAALLLFWIELYRRSKRSRHDDIKELKYTYSLEHIMPQKWEEYWGNIPTKFNPDGSKMSEEDAKKDRKEKIYWIGNMTLLRSTLNSALRNYPFEKKMNGEGRKKGIKAYADLLITRDDIVEPYDRGDKNWDEKKIKERTNKLENEIKEIWDFQSEKNLHENATK